MAHPVMKKKKVKSEILTAEIEPDFPRRRRADRHGDVRALTKKKKKIKTKVLGTAAVSGGDATVTLKPKLVLGKVDHDHLQRRHRFHGEHADRAQAVEEGRALTGPSKRLRDSECLV